MPRRNRVDPWGDLHAMAERGLLTGNRGCLVDADRRLVRHHRGSLWITCLTNFRDRRNELDRPGRWTPLFFLDDAVALAAGHRPCGECRRADYVAYRAGTGSGGAVEIDRRLSPQRLRRGRGLERRADRVVWWADLADLPPGTVIADPADRALLVGARTLQPFDFSGWSTAEPRSASGPVRVLTPPISVAALSGGFRPLLHPSAADAGARGPDEPGS